MNARSDRLAIAVAQLNPVVGDIAGNADKARRAREQAAAAGADLVVFSELFIAGYPPEDLVLKPAFQAACRSAVEALARETADGGPARAHRHALGRGRQALQRRRAARRRTHRGRALQGRSAELRRVRREARVRAGPAAGAGRLPRRAHRRADLRGHLDRRTSCECLAETGAEILHRAERLALLARQARRAPQRRGRARHRDRPAAGLCQPGRRPGRAGVRRRLVRAQRRPLARVPAAGLRGDRRAHAMAARAGDGWRCVDGPDGAARGGRRGRLRRLRARACATTSTRTAFPAWCSACPAASTPRSARRWRSMRSAPSACTA